MPVPRFTTGMQGPAKVVVQVAEAATRNRLEPVCRNLPLWDALLGPVFEQAVREAGIPEAPLDPVKIAQGLGLLPKRLKGR